MDSTEENKPLAAINVPSADLINFRFDQQEKAIRELRTEAKQNFDVLSHKMDYAIQTFITRPEFLEIKEAKEREHIELWTAIAAIKAAARWWIATGIAAFAALAGMIYTLTHLHTGG